MNYLALLGWAPSGGTRETFTPQELVKEFSLERVTPSPAIFDMEKLHWLNRHYIKKSPPERIHRLTQPFFLSAGLLPENADEKIQQWFGMLVNLFAPYVDKLEQLPQQASRVFHYNAAAALSEPDNAEVLAVSTTPAVVGAFAKKVGNEFPLTPERFKTIMNEIKAETGAKGKDLFHPVRIILTGFHSGPDFDRMIPLLEEGSTLNLPVHVKSVRERVSEFVAAYGNRA
jgi:glutamyl-tRNA synthetase/nondiscriminating glutamyl-tRNA synthetase